MTDLVHYRAPVIFTHDQSRGPLWTDLYIRPGTSDEAVLHECFVADIYHVSSVAEHLQREDPNGPPKRVLDVGACTGIFSALIAQLAPAARITAIEPDRANLELLTLNTAHWRDRVEIVPAALGAEAGSAYLIGSHGTGHTGSYPDADVMLSGTEPKVKVLPLADFLHEPVAFMKMDVEGAEHSIIAACPSEALARVDHIAMEWHGTSEAPWLDDAPRLYGETLSKLAYTHSVQVFGSPAAGGYLWGHRNNL